MCEDTSTIPQDSPTKGMCHMSHITGHLSPDHHSVQFQLLLIPRRFVDVAAGGLWIDRVKKLISAKHQQRNASSYSGNLRKNLFD